MRLSYNSKSSTRCGYLHLVPMWFAKSRYLPGGHVLSVESASIKQTHDHHFPGYRIQSLHWEVRTFNGATESCRSQQGRIGVEGHYPQAQSCSLAGVGSASFGMPPPQHHFSLVFLHLVSRVSLLASLVHLLPRLVLHSETQWTYKCTRTLKEGKHGCHSVAGTSNSVSSLRAMG